MSYEEDTCHMRPLMPERAFPRPEEEDTCHMRRIHVT